MAFYESIFIIRQDVSSSDVDKIIDDFTNIIKNMDGSVHKTEYWGLRPLAYEINGNRKGHYYLLGIEANNALLIELDRKIKLSESVIRSSIVRVEQISQEPSPILKAKNSDNDNTIDVTINKKSA